MSELDAAKLNEPEQTTSPPTLLDAALDNLDTASQYIDEGLFPFEQKLISFYYGFALLTKYRDNPDRRATAKRYLIEAADWLEDQAILDQMTLSTEAVRFNVFEATQKQPTKENLKRAIKRIKSEALYNLAVLYHLDKEYEEASRHYSEAARVVANDQDFNGLAILAEFGCLSAIIDPAWPSEDQTFQNGRIQDILRRTPDLSQRIENLQNQIVSVTAGINVQRPSRLSQDFAAEGTATAQGQSSLSRTSKFLRNIRDVFSREEFREPQPRWSEQTRITSNSAVLERIMNKLGVYRSAINSHVSKSTFADERLEE